MFVVQNVCDEDDADDVGGGGGLYDKGYVSTIQDSVLTLSILNFFLSMMMRMVIRMVTMTIMVFLMTRFVIGVSASTLSIKREHSSLSSLQCFVVCCFDFESCKQTKIMLL